MTDLTLASWNIRAGLGGDLRRRPMRTIEVIAEMDADIVVLQEADFRRHPRPAALPRLLGRIGPFEVVDLTPTDVGLGWHGIAMLKRPDIQVESILRLDLPALEPRGAVIVDLATATHQVRVVGVHMGLLRRNRRKQIAYVVDQLTAMERKPTIMVGDFNEWRALKGLETLPKWLTMHSPGPTFPAGRPLLNLDRVAFSDDIFLVESRVSDDAHARIASDHRPIRVTLRLPDKTLDPT